MLCNGLLFIPGYIFIIDCDAFVELFYFLNGFMVQLKTGIGFFQNDFSWKS